MDNEFLETVKVSGIQTKNKWPSVFSACVISLVTVFGLTLFPVFGFFLAFAIGSIVQVGLKSYNIALLEGKEPGVELIFSKFKYGISAFCLAVLKIGFVFLWTLALIIPGIIAAINYSFSCFILSENDGMDAMSALRQSKKLVYGHRANILLLYLSYMLIFVMLASACFGITLLINLAIAIPLWLKLVIALGLTTVIFTVFIMPFAEISMTKVYLDAKKKIEPIKKRKSVSKKSK